MTRTTIRIDDKLLKTTTKASIEQGLTSFNEYVTKALEHFLTCKSIDTNAPMKMIVLQYPAKCLRCTSQIQAGSWAMYGRGIGAICIDCFVERVGDKALIAKFLKMREYQQIIKALKIEAERLASEVELYKIGEKTDIMRDTLKNISLALRQYLEQGIATPQEKDRLQELLTLVAKGFEVTRDVQTIIERDIQKKPFFKKKIAGLT